MTPNDQLLRDIAAQDPVTFSADTPLPYRQLAHLVNNYQTRARLILGTPIDTANAEVADLRKYLDRESVPTVIGDMTLTLLGRVNYRVEMATDPLQRRIKELGFVYAESGRQIERLDLALARRQLTVWEGAMPESNGRSNFTAVLHRKDSKGLDAFTDGFQFSRSEYPDRVRYDADFMRWLIGERVDNPDMWDKCYDMGKHSGYVPQDHERYFTQYSLTKACAALGLPDSTLEALRLALQEQK